MIRTHAFDLFVRYCDQGPRGHSSAGLGIGLALVRAIVEQQGGAVEAPSAGAGCGSTFKVRLPVSEMKVACSCPQPWVQCGFQAVEEDLSVDRLG